MHESRTTHSRLKNNQSRLFRPLLLLVASVSVTFVFSSANAQETKSKTKTDNPQAAFRLWTNLDGKTARLELVKPYSKTAKFRDANGKIFRVKIKDLCKEDQEYLKKLVLEKKARARKLAEEKKQRKLEAIAKKNAAKLASLPPYNGSGEKAILNDLINNTGEPGNAATNLSQSAELMKKIDGGSSRKNPDLPPLMKYSYATTSDFYDRDMIVQRFGQPDENGTTELVGHDLTSSTVNTLKYGRLEFLVDDAGKLVGLQIHSFL